MAKCFLFDIDGVLIDSSEALYNCFKDCFEKFGYPNAVSKEKILALRAETNDVIARKLVPQASAETLKKMTDFALENYPVCILKHGKPVEGTKQTLRGLKQKGAKLGIVTNQESRDVDASLSLIGFEDFDAIVYYQEGIKPKPDAEPLLKALEKTGCAASEALYIGDSAIDIQAGKNAGVKTILLENDLNKEIDCVKIKSLKELIEYEERGFA